MEEIALHHQSNRLPNTMPLKSREFLHYHNSRDPTLTAPKNLIQSEDMDNHGGQIYASDRVSSQEGWIEKQAEQPPATKGIYQALKRGIRRLSGFRRNNSA